MSANPALKRALDLLSHPFNDYGNARRLVDIYGGRLRYCTPMKKWLVWDGCRYQLDETDEIRRLTQNAMIEFARQALATGNDTTARFAGGCLNSQRLSSAIREAQPLLAVTPQELDANPWLLNFRNGTLDLRSFQLLPHSQAQLITKLVRHGYYPEASCPRFLAFMERILGTLVPYVQKSLGYSITGVTTEKVIFICHGETDSGKTTLLELFRNFFGDYSTLIDVESLMTRNHEDNNSRADLADLRGVRFAMASESQEGQFLNEARLKRLTQGQGLIKSVRKYENPIQFPVTHKLWLDTNHKPLFRRKDNAVLNRLISLHFDRPLKHVEIDRELPEKLREEAEGVVAWAVEGARRWHSEKLGRIAAVEAGGSELRFHVDQLSAFRRECCMESPMVQTTARPLYLGYKRWAEERAERPMSETAFGLRLAQDFVKREDGMGRVLYHGIALLEDCQGLKLN